MRDLTNVELGHIYGAGGTGCSPTPPSCGGGGSHGKGSHGKGSKAKGSKAKGSKAKGSKAKGGSKGYHC